MRDEYVRIKREVNPACKLPDDLDTAAWRYMDFWKFESLLKDSAFYLCRADRLHDKFEGTYSRQQVLDINSWLKSQGYPEIVDSERECRLLDRERTYINCWCLGPSDLDLMWKAYVREPPGVAVKSRVRLLQKACDDAVERWPLDISLVRYFDHAEGEEISYFGSPAIFFHKDVHFRLDNELRIVYWPNMTPPTPDHVLLPVSLSETIVSVVLSPGAPIEFVKKVREILDKAGLGDVPVEASRDDREMID